MSPLVEAKNGNKQDLTLPSVNTSSLLRQIVFPEPQPAKNAVLLTVGLSACRWWPLCVPAGLPVTGAIRSKSNVSSCAA